MRVPRAVFGVDVAVVLPYRIRVDRIDTLPASRSTSDHRRPSTSPRRIPVVAISAQIADQRYDCTKRTNWRRLGHRISVENTPMRIGAQNAQEFTLEQIEWTIENDEWTFSPAGAPCRDVYFVLDDPDSVIDGPRIIGC